MSKVLLNLLKGNTFLFIVTFINSILLARLFSSEDIGVIRTLTLYGSVVVVIGTFQFHVSILKFLTNIKREKFRINLSIKFVLFSAIITTVLYYLIVFVLLNESNFFKHYIIYGLTLVPIIFFSMLQNFYVAVRKSKKIVKIFFFYGVFMILLTFVVGFFNLDLKFYFTGLLLILLGMLLPWFNDIIDLKDLRITKGNYAKINDQIKYSLPLIFSNSLYLFMSRFDKFWMSFFYTTSIIGNYFVVAFENPLNSIVISSSMNEVTHSMSILLEQNKRKEMLEKWNSSIFFITSALFLPSLFLFVNADFFIRFLFGEKYVSQNLIFKIYCFLPFVRTGSYQSLLRVFSYTKFHLINTMISLTSTVLIGVLISFYFDYKMFPIAYLFGYFVYNVGVVSYMSYKEKLGFVKLYGIKVIFKQVLIVVIVYTIWYKLNINELNFYLSNLLLFFTYIVFYSLFFYKRIIHYINEKFI